VLAAAAMLLCRRLDRLALAAGLPLAGAQLFLALRAVLGYDGAAGLAFWRTQAVEFALTGAAGTAVAGAWYAVARRRGVLIPTLAAGWADDAGGADPLVRPDETIHELQALNRRLAAEVRWRARQIETSPTPIVALTRRDEMVAENEAARRLLAPLAVTADDARRVARELRERRHEDTPVRLPTTAADSRPQVLEYRYFAPLDGRELFFATDVTRYEQRRRSEAIQRSVGQIHRTGQTIAHDFGNLLLAIEASAVPLAGAGEPGDAALARIRDAVAQGRRMLEDLRSHAFLGLPNIEVLEAAALLDDTAELVAPLYRPRGQRVRRIGGGALAVLGDRQQLVRVLSNLCNNAARASADGAEIRLRAEPAGEEVRLAVEDDGEGMSGEQVAQVFAPGFSGRGDGRAGLGLAIAQLIVDAHAGRIRIDSRLGVGTRVAVTLPRATAGATDVRPSRSAASTT
jgi:signal transduction histidine kinase